MRRRWLLLHRPRGAYMSPLSPILFAGCPYPQFISDGDCDPCELMHMMSGSRERYLALARGVPAPLNCSPATGFTVHSKNRRGYSVSYHMAFHLMLCSWAANFRGREFVCSRKSPSGMETLDFNITMLHDSLKTM